MIRFDILTIFPNIFSGFVSESLLAKAQHKKLIAIHTHNLRDWTDDRHQTVDGKPYGGGPGLVFKVEPIFKAVRDIQKKIAHKSKNKKAKKSRVILFSPRGNKLTGALAKQWSTYDQLVLICGRYEGIDERVADYIADDVVSLGDYVLNGGEVAAMAVIETVSRFVSGFMHTPESATKEDWAQYTKPEIFSPPISKKISTQKGSKKKPTWRVPKVLLSGDHAKIQAWRKDHKKTLKRGH